jgi:hypothetical protein
LTRAKLLEFPVAAGEAEADGMLVEHIALDNIKCFRKGTQIDLTAGRAAPHKWIVVYGDNGLGKSTLLKALGMSLLGQAALNMLLPSAEGWVRGDNKAALIQVRAQKGTGDKSPGRARRRSIRLNWGLIGASPFARGAKIFPQYSITLAEDYQDVLGTPGRRARAAQHDEDVRLFNEHIATDEPKRGWLICGYGPHRRLTGASSELTTRIPPDGRASRLVTLFHEGAALTSAESWLRTLDHHASRDKDGGARRRLDAVVNMINTGLLHGDVELTEITPEGVYFKTPFGLKIPFDELSDGYRTVLALALDLLRHIEYCFDLDSVLHLTEGRAVITAEGVVLIDEIDAHLHPSWQKTIGAWLHERFPNVQFIVATHSPLIATRVSSTEGLVVRLVRSDEGKGDVVEVITEEGTIGLTADQKLTGPDFGLRSTRDVLADDMAREIQELGARARRGEASPAERKRLMALSEEYARIAPATPTYEGIARWREDEERIRAANERVARAERKRR